jgi:hypothetical protein
MCVFRYLFNATLNVSFLSEIVLRLTIPVLLYNTKCQHQQ